MYDEGMESGSVMVPASGMDHMSKEELKHESALLFGLIFLAYLGIGDEHFFLLFFFITFFVCCLYFPFSLSMCTSSLFLVFVLRS